MEPNTLFRYQYLAGNPVSGGWASWNTPAGAFGNFSPCEWCCKQLNMLLADWYIGETLDANRVPVFTFYVMLSTDPQNGEGKAFLLLNHVLIVCYRPTRSPEIKLRSIDDRLLQ